MSTLHQHFYHTTTSLDWILLTADARQVARAAGGDGALLVSVPAPGAGILLTDTHPDVRDALREYLTRLGEPFDRQMMNRRREPLSLAARVQAAILGRSVLVPIVGGDLACSTDTDVVLIDCDPRVARREVQMLVLSAGGGGASAGGQGGPPPGDPYGP